MPRPKPEQILTVKELSAYLRCHPSTVYRIIARGEVPYFKIGSDFRFRLSQIEKWIEEHSSPAHPAKH